MPALCTNTLNGTHFKNSAFEWPNAEITSPPEIEKKGTERSSNNFLPCIYFAYAYAPILILKQETLKFAGILQNEKFY